MASFTIPLLFALPTELIIDIFSRWLSLSDLSRFDFALCQHAHRKNYLITLRSYPWHSFLAPNHRQSAGLLKFLLARQVSIGELIISGYRGQWPTLNSPSTSVVKVSSLLRTVHTLHLDYASGLGLDWLNKLLLSGDLSQLKSVAITGFKKSLDKDFLPILATLSQCKVESFDFSGCWKMSDKVLDVLGKLYFATLKSINLSACFNLTSEGLQHFAQRCLKLESFTAAYCETVEDEVLITIAEHNPFLTSLDLNGCTNITDESIALMSSQLTNLTRVFLSGTRLLTDNSLLFLSHIPHLQELNLESCTRITQDGVCLLIRNCPTLRHLMLRHCLTATIGGPKSIGKAVRSASLTDEQFEELTVTVN